MNRQTMTLKTIASLAMTLVCTMTMVACGSNGGGTSNNDQVRLANVPNANQCRQSSTYGGTGWNQYSNAGFLPYGSGYNNSYYGNSYGNYGNSYGNSYGSGCGPGYMTICDARFGLICAPRNQYGSANVAWYGYNANALRFYGYGYGSYGYSGYSGYGYPQYPSYGSSYNVGYAAGYNSYNGFYFGRTCSVGYNSCGGGKFCQPMNWSSPIGVCVKN
jgi:hypothetical protein